MNAYRLEWIGMDANEWRSLGYGDVAELLEDMTRALEHHAPEPPTPQIDTRGKET